MKDIIITGKALKKEAFIALGCFFVAFCLNVFAIIHYSRPAVELVSQIGYVVVVAVALYAILWIIRLIILLIKWIVRKFY